MVQRAVIFQALTNRNSDSANKQVDLASGICFLKIYYVFWAKVLTHHVYTGFENEDTHTAIYIMP